LTGVDARTSYLEEGGNIDKHLVVWLHLHACSGKRICQWALEANKDKKSGIKMDGMQVQTAACNQIDPDPPDVWLREKLHTCHDMERFCKNHGGSTFMMIETPLDVQPPCPGISFITVIRQPWLRLESTQGKQGWMFPNASAVIKRMKEGDDVLLDSSGWWYCIAPHAPICQGFFKAGYFNNYYIRTILGFDEGAHIPWMKVDETHFEKAKRILEAFDLVIPIDHMADALGPLQCALGPRYDVGLDGSLAGRYSWSIGRKPADVKRAECDMGKVQSRNDRERMELCQLFNKHNYWDIKLYEWVLHRWRDWRAGRCRGGG